MKLHNIEICADSNNGDLLLVQTNDDGSDDSVIILSPEQIEIVARWMLKFTSEDNKA
jgi:hypothetical protein